MIPVKRPSIAKTPACQRDPDEEGVPAGRVTLVENGILKNFLLTRRPMRTFNFQRPCAPGRVGERGVAGLRQYFCECQPDDSRIADESKLIERIKAAGLKYGVMIRRLDFPSAAAVEDLRSTAAQLQKGGGRTQSLTAPLASYRVYTDGREELVRGLLFGDAAAPANTLWVICPSLLFHSFDLNRAQGDNAKPPLVPAPSLAGQ